VRRAPVALLGALCALALAACGGSAVSLEAQVAEAATTTTDAGSYRASFRLTMSGAGGPSVSMTGDGLFDTRARVGRMTFDMGELGAAVGQDLGETDVVYARTAIFMRMPFLQQLRPGLKPWIKFDLERLAEQNGLDLGQLGQLQQADPAEALSYLRGVSGKVTEVGEERVRGVETTHYRMTVDLRNVVEQAPAAQRPEIRRAVDRVLRQTSVRTVPTDAWIGEDGLVRRLVVDYRGMALAPGQQGRVRVATELYDFGVEVDVEEPPASATTDVQDLIASGEGS